MRLKLSDIFRNFRKLIEAIKWLWEFELLRADESKSESMLRLGLMRFREVFL